MIESKFVFYITKSPIKIGEKEKKHLPVILKFDIEKANFPFEFTNRNEAEGPFSSIYELKKKSFILASVRNLNNKSKILQSKNIQEVIDVIQTEVGSTYSIEFMNALVHTTAGKISKHDVKGIHFYNPDRIKIIEKIQIDKDTNAYNARISLKNSETGEWIEKKSVTSFFPDHWSYNKLFHECSYAYNNRKLIEGRKYDSVTLCGLKMRFIIDEDGLIKTFFPIIE